jgi:hypothetical protein
MLINILGNMARKKLVAYLYLVDPELETCWMTRAPSFSRHGSYLTGGRDWNLAPGGDSLRRVYWASFFSGQNSGFLL